MRARTRCQRLLRASNTSVGSIGRTFALVFLAIQCKRSTSVELGTLASKQIGRRSRNQRIFDHPNVSSMSSTQSAKTEIICTKFLASRRSVSRSEEHTSELQSR